MLRHRDRRISRVPAVLLYSSRSLEDVIYLKELDAMARRDPDLRVVNTLTRKQPEGWSGYGRRIDKSLLGDACFRAQWPMERIKSTNEEQSSSSSSMIAIKRLATRRNRAVFGQRPEQNWERARPSGGPVIF